MVMKESKMSEEFHEWLKECPVHWYRVEVGEYYTKYAFYSEDEEE